MKLTVITRACGECTACCTAVSVEELDKGQNVRCQHLSSTSGCAIYQDRPASCRKYNCLWLKGELPEKYRPDKSGVVFSWGDSPNGKAALIANLLSKDIPWERADYLAAKIFTKYERALLVIQTSDSWIQLGTTITAQRQGLNATRQLKDNVFLAYARQNSRDSSESLTHKSGSEQ
jgi:Fe-S-cluster containining protein